jgi:hypothetical protein
MSWNWVDNLNFLDVWLEDRRTESSHIRNIPQRFGLTSPLEKEWMRTTHLRWAVHVLARKKGAQAWGWACEPACGSAPARRPRAAARGPEIANYVIGWQNSVILQDNPNHTSSLDDKTIKSRHHRHCLHRRSVGDVVLHRATKQATAMQRKSLQAAANCVVVMT